MLSVIVNTAPLLFGMFLLMLGNGLQGTALGLRGDIESFGNLAMGFVMSGYFAGFLLGARATPWLLRRVGHVRVFAALASVMSAAMILYAAFVHPVAWVVMRVVVGFAMSGAYVVAESWLNAGVTNQNRGKALSAYLIVQMLGIVLAQSLINLADPAGYDLFVIMAVVVSLAVVPILLSATPAPVFERSRGISLGQLFHTSPLAFVGTVLLGGIFACLFGMAAVYATAIGMTTAEISIFIGSIYVGGLVLQYPIGWISDRVDRRRLIIMLTLIGMGAAVLAILAKSNVTAIIAAAFLIGGMANPLYSVLVAHMNDFLEAEDMPAAAGGLIMLNGIGATGTPIIVGVVMDSAGPGAFMVFIAALMGLIAVYALYRSTVRAATPSDETSPYAPIGMVSGPVAATASSEYVADMAQAQADEREAAETAEASGEIDPHDRAPAA